MRRPMLKVSSENSIIDARERDIGGQYEEEN